MVLLLAAAQAQAQRPAAVSVYTLDGKVVKVADGDTLTLLSGRQRLKVRLASIDAPEVRKDKLQPGQPYAQQSRKALAALVAGKVVVLRCYERDRYARNICDVMLADGSTASQRQVAQGMAWANMEAQGRFMRDTRLPQLEQQARRQRLGLWQRADAVQPWVWRDQCWRKGRCS
jgi:endonuclease YncB( thermonuclease family)